LPQIVWLKPCEATPQKVMELLWFKIFPNLFLNVKSS
jgi:hypothetical protein